MIRTGFKRPERIDPKTGEVRFSTFKKPNKPTLGAKKTATGAPAQLRKTELERARFKWKPRRPKPGDEPRYKAWVKTLCCCVGGLECGLPDPHHMINGKGDARKGMGQTAPDKYLIPMCRGHHDDFHDRKGFCFGWDDAQRLTFQEQEVERLREIWRDLNELEVWQEPARKAI